MKAGYGEGKVLEKDAAGYRWRHSIVSVYFGIRSFEPLCLGKWLREARAIEISRQVPESPSIPESDAYEHSVSQRIPVNAICP